MEEEEEEEEAAAESERSSSWSSSLNSGPSSIGRGRGPLPAAAMAMGRGSGGGGGGGVMKNHLDRIFNCSGVFFGIQLKRRKPAKKPKLRIDQYYYQAEMKVKQQQLSTSAAAAAAAAASPSSSSSWAPPRNVSFGCYNRSVRTAMRAYNFGARVLDGRAAAKLHIFPGGDNRDPLLAFFLLSSSSSSSSSPSNHHILDPIHPIHPHDHHPIHHPHPHHQQHQYHGIVSSTIGGVASASSSSSSSAAAQRVAEAAALDYETRVRAAVLSGDSDACERLKSHCKAYAHSMHEPDDSDDHVDRVLSYWDRYYHHHAPRRKLARPDDIAPSTVTTSPNYRILDMPPLQPPMISLPSPILDVAACLVSSGPQSSRQRRRPPSMISHSDPAAHPQYLPKKKQKQQMQDSRGTSTSIISNSIPVPVTTVAYNYRDDESADVAPQLGTGGGTIMPPSIHNHVVGLADAITPPLNPPPIPIPNPIPNPNPNPNLDPNNPLVSPEVGSSGAILRNSSVAHPAATAHFSEQPPVPMTMSPPAARISSHNTNPAHPPTSTTATTVDASTQFNHHRLVHTGINHHHGLNLHHTNNRPHIGRVVTSTTDLVKGHSPAQTSSLVHSTNYTLGSNPNPAHSRVDHNSGPPGNYSSSSGRHPTFHPVQDLYDPNHVLDYSAPINLSSYTTATGTANPPPYSNRIVTTLSNIATTSTNHSRMPDGGGLMHVGVTAAAPSTSSSTYPHYTHDPVSIRNHESPPIVTTTDHHPATYTFDHAAAAMHPPQLMITSRPLLYNNNNNNNNNRNSTLPAIVRGDDHDIHHYSNHSRRGGISYHQYGGTTLDPASTSRHNVGPIVISDDPAGAAAAAARHELPTSATASIMSRPIDIPPRLNLDHYNTVYENHHRTPVRLHIAAQGEDHDDDQRHYDNIDRTRITTLGFSANSPPPAHTPPAHAISTPGLNMIINTDTRPPSRTDHTMSMIGGATSDHDLLHIPKSTTRNWFTIDIDHPRAQYILQSPAAGGLMPTAAGSILGNATSGRSQNHAVVFTPDDNYFLSTSPSPALGQPLMPSTYSSVGTGTGTDPYLPDDFELDMAAVDFHGSPSTSRFCMDHDIAPDQQHDQYSFFTTPPHFMQLHHDTNHHSEQRLRDHPVSTIPLHHQGDDDLFDMFDIVGDPSPEPQAGGHLNQLRPANR